VNKFFAAGLAIIVLSGVIMVSYNTGMKDAEQKVTHTEDETETNVSDKQAQLPPSHSDVDATNSPAVNPEANFTHFRVGSRNVKKILADGDIVWIGTSGGVIRYNIIDDSYELLDAKSGLLAIGVFHLSKLNGRLVAGTYGGGLSILKEDNKGWDIYNIPDGLADAFVYDVLETDKGDIWIATWSGANLVRGGQLGMVIGKTGNMKMAWVPLMS
jgi:ligand-binding sensor domain-containing protein